MWAKIYEYWQALKDFVWSCFLSLIEMLKDVAIWIFESLLEIVLLAINGLSSLFGTLDVTQYLTALPPEVRNILGLIGIDTASQMIVLALLIRMTLQLIPFTRLGS